MQEYSSSPNWVAIALVSTLSFTLCHVPAALIVRAFYVVFCDEPALTHFPPLNSNHYKYHVSGIGQPTVQFNTVLKGIPVDY